MVVAPVALVVGSLLQQGLAAGAGAGLTRCWSKTCRQSTSRVVVSIVVVVTVAVGARRRSTSRGGGARV